MWNIVEKKDKEFFFFSFFFSFRSIFFMLSDEASEAFDSFDQLHFFFFFSFLLLTKERTKWQWHIDTSRKKSTYLRKKRGNIYYYPHHHIDALLVQSILSFSHVFFSFCSFVFAIAVRRFDVCLFFFLCSFISLCLPSFSLSSDVFGAVSFSLLLTNAITTLVDDLVDYFLKTKQVAHQWMTGEFNNKDSIWMVSVQYIVIIRYLQDRRHIKSIKPNKHIHINNHQQYQLKLIQIL